VPVLRLMSGDMTCVMCRLKIKRVDEASTRDETFSLLSDGRPMHSRCLRNDLLDEPGPAASRARKAPKANGILAKKRGMAS
jgi:hypothetical protein